MTLTSAFQNGTSEAVRPDEVCDQAALARTPVQHDPFDHLIVENFIRPAALQSIYAGFPKGLGPGSHPAQLVPTSGALKTLIDELHGKRFEAEIEDKFGLRLAGMPTACTLRTETNARDGHIHTDSRSKIITVLLYLNESWDHEGGRLRLLRSSDNLDDFVAEISPVGGTLLVFRRSDNSWHGHHVYTGERRAIQFNWMTRSTAQFREHARHSLSHLLKKVIPLRG